MTTRLRKEYPSFIRLIKQWSTTENSSSQFLSTSGIVFRKSFVTSYICLFDFVNNTKFLKHPMVKPHVQLRYDKLVNPKLTPNYHHKISNLPQQLIWMPGSQAVWQSTKLYGVWSQLTKHKTLCDCEILRTLSQYS